jgi:aryl-alcohol dehydrogenase-like predicted oxidoreductase
MVGQLAALAESEGHTLLELAFGWLLAHEPVASVIAGATTPEQVAANVAAGSWRPGPEVMARVDAIAPR